MVHPAGQQLFDRLRGDGPEPAAALIVAHPDDEVIGLGGHLDRLPHIHIVHVTDGAPPDPGDAHTAGCETSEEYAALRFREFAAAMKVVGIGPGQCHRLGFGDQRTSHVMPEVIDAVTEMLDRLRPAVVLTHAYEGGHPDHDTTALAVHIACERLRRHVEIAIVEMAGYHQGPEGIRTCEFLPGNEAICTLTLNAERRAMKRRLFDCYPSQRETLRYFPMDLERLRRAPRYDFTRPPHPEPLFYDQFRWGISGQAWRALAARVIGTPGMGLAP